jgi:transposase
MKSNYHQQRNTPTAAQSKHPECRQLKIGIDEHTGFCVISLQRDHGAISAGRRVSRAELVELVEQAIARGEEVHTVQESCGFGFGLHRELGRAGAHSLVVCPQPLNEDGRRRKTDKLDALRLCQRLSRFLEGNRDELRPVRIPTAEEEARRAVVRQREQWLKKRRMLENEGRSLLVEQGHYDAPAHWWGARTWKKLSPALAAWLRELLEPRRTVLAALCAQISALTEALEQSAAAAAAERPTPKGLGALTRESARREVCDWHRFNNRKQTGSYMGLCPSEWSSGGPARRGAIDRHGNRRLRAMLVEAVWRMLRWQPHWWALSRFRAKLASGSPTQKRKAVVALARQLAIDLWRYETGRATLAALGWQAA